VPAREREPEPAQVPEREPERVLVPALAPVKVPVRVQARWTKATAIHHPLHHNRRDRHLTTT
jgi:hypothetical protein